MSQLWVEMGIGFRDIVLAYMVLIHCISTVFLNSEKDSDIKVCDGGAF
jgi:hypothetical protein